MSDEKPREYYIKPEFNIDSGLEYSVPVCNRNIWDVPVVHVIEFSAYEKLRKEVEHAANTALRIAESKSELADRYARLLAENAELRRRLQLICGSQEG